MVPVVAGVLGIVAGVTTALVVEADDAGPGEVIEDPLRLGIPLVDLDCNDETVLVVGSGDSAAPLLEAIANNPDLPLSYLRPAESCGTQWAPGLQDAPEYAVYAGPYDQPTDPCELRMSPDNKGDVVTKLTAGNETFVKCLCVLPVSTFPDLIPGMAVDPGNAIWVRSLQGMLIDLDNQREEDGDPPPYFTNSGVTGVYDDTTQARIEAYQPERDIEVGEYGSVLTATWRALTDDTCKLYDF
jgi:hypothetical protein